MQAQNLSPEALLADLLSSFGTLPPKSKKTRSPSERRLSPPPLPQHKAFAKSKTGYTTWKAVSRVIQIQEQHCNACGHVTPFVKGEFFALENGTAHATWLRSEAYGIDNLENLPNEFVDLDPVFIAACPHCRSTPFDDLSSLLFPRQMELSL